MDRSRGAPWQKAGSASPRLLGGRLNIIHKDQTLYKVQITALRLVGRWPCLEEKSAMFEGKCWLDTIFQQFPTATSASEEEQKLSKELLFPWRWKSNNAKRRASHHFRYKSIGSFSLLRIHATRWCMGEFGGSTNMLTQGWLITIPSPRREARFQK